MKLMEIGFSHFCYNSAEQSKQNILKAIEQGVDGPLEDMERS